MISPSGQPLLNVKNLSVAYRQGSGWMRVVDDVSFSICKGEVFGLVGESGCGKSTVALQLLGYRHRTMRTDNGEVLFNGRDVPALGRSELDALRGNRVSFVPQNPTTALNPGMRVGRQVAEVLSAHRSSGGDQISQQPAELFDLVGLPSARSFMRRYPHQLSGGQQQRVCIAMALACDPDLVVLDEPTTGLDVTTQEQIISLLIGLRARLGMSMLYVTHDLGLLSQIADRVGVMYAGRMVEVGGTADLFLDPRHPYTRGLIASIPRIDDPPSMPSHTLHGFLQRQSLPAGCPFSPRCDYALSRCFEERQELMASEGDRAVACWRWREIGASSPRKSESPISEMDHERVLLLVDKLSVRYGVGRRRFTALRDISFTVKEGETFALVGESGSGKSTLARAISGQIAPIAGRIELAGSNLAGQVGYRNAEQRRLIQYVFQNPDASLNPRARVGGILARPLTFFFGVRGSKAQPRIDGALADVRLDQRYSRRFPDELSGGERQRVAIARALIAEPALLLCDEVLSALDVSVQANILALLRRLKTERRVTMLFISHDLAVVRSLADHVCVLFRGEIMEIGPREQVFAAPFHPYTHSLLRAIPTPLKRNVPTPIVARAADQSSDSAGCAYAGRCPWQLGPICERERPPWRHTQGLSIRCHLSLEELTLRAEWPARNEVEINSNAEGMSA